MTKEVRLVGLGQDFLIHQTLADFKQGGYVFKKADWSPYFEAGILGTRLSKLTRWNGQFRGNTVASHSILVHSMVSALTDGNPLARLLALLHDASEAYLGDIASPLKVMIPDYLGLEQTVMSLVHKYYEIPDWESSDFPEVVAAMEVLKLCDKRCSDVECFTINEDYMRLMGYLKVPQLENDVAYKYTTLLDRAVRDYAGVSDDGY